MRLFLLFVLFLYSTSSFAQLMNGDFESWTSGDPDDWTIIDSGINVTEENTIIDEGTSSASIEVTTAFQGSTDFRQVVTVEANTTYNISVRIYHTEGFMEARLYVDGYLNYSTDNTTGSWQDLTNEYTSSSAGTIEIGLRFYDSPGFDGSEIVYVDDFQFVADNVCSVSNVAVTNQGTCNGDNAEYTVCADVSNGSGDYDLVDTDNANSVIQSLTGQPDGQICFNVTMTGPTSASSINVDVVDNSDATCIGGIPVTVNIPECPEPEPVVRINEVDANTPGTDDEEFIELFGPANYDLTGMVLVLFNGNGDISYDAFDLDGENLDANGYFILGNSGAPGSPEITFSNEGLQNGADAVALYMADGSDFPNGTDVTDTDLLDALVYDNNDSDDTGLINGLGVTEQINESENGMSTTQSIQRGSWFVATPTPRGENILPVELLSFSATPQSDKVEITWATASEINNDYFIVQTQDETSNWSDLSMIQGAGNSSEVIEYSYMDNRRLSGTQFYRLLQVDYDGTESYSKIERVSIEGSELKWPTLVTTNLQTDINGSFSIFNGQGQLISTDQTQNGLINVSELTSGTYILRAEGSVHRFIKQ